MKSASIDTLVSALSLANLAGLAALWLAYRVVLALYNISPWHPLSRFPGPRLAAMTLLYEFWYDMVLVGRYTREIEKMHHVYGPIVRISPDELHCNDPAFLDEIYAGAGRKRNKPEHFLNSIAGPPTVSTFGTIDHDHHRIRRNAVNKFFSRAGISRLEGEMKELVQQLCDKLLRNPTKGPINITTAYSCFTSDMISAYCFGAPLGFLAQPGWEPNFREAMNAFLNTTFLFRFFPALRSVVSVAPMLSRYMGDDLRILMTEMYENMPARIRKTMADHAAGVTYARPTVFTDLLDSSLPAHEKTEFRLAGEGFSLTGAGTETTSWTLSVITYHLLAQPALLKRLTEELRAADPAQLESWATLEQIPYLYGVIMEGLRLSYGETARSPRVPRDENLTYSGDYNGRHYEYVIPKGTSIGASAVLIHHNEELFPDSEAFRPERWLDGAGQRQRGLEKGMLAFSRGSRQCLGSNLANCELYLATVALTFRVFPHMKLFETTIDDVRYDHDLVVSQAKPGSKGVRIVMP